jgi:hypothetical protein
MREASITAVSGSASSGAQGLKPASLLAAFGTAKAVPFQNMHETSIEAVSGSGAAALQG